MRIIFVKDHIVDDVYGIKVYEGRTGVLLDEATGMVELDAPDAANVNKEVVSGLIDSVQPGTYILRRDDVE